MFKIWGGPVRGIRGMVDRLNTIKGETAKGMEIGLKKAALFLQRKSQEIVPVDTGALKNSAFTRTKGSGFSTEATVGYTQSYAIYVHERTDLRHKPGKSAKFLEKPANKYRKEMIRIIREEAQKKSRGKG